ncbi:MAG: adenylate/guanylate cyclase domain-containing protein [Gammaproteobacteria bacterium]|nr:adenylate/guanylate cyclase domain-containing protein [Gammaproteobacteria bacterium]
MVWDAKKQMWTFVQSALDPRYRRAVAAAIFVAAVGGLLNLSSWGMSLDRNVGLRVLYQLRGPLPPPSDVVIVSMNKRSIDRLGLPSNVSDWPRALHASMITRLTERGAAVIVFDVLFKEKRRQDTDAQLGEAIAKSSRTVLLQFLGRDTISRQDINPNGKVVSEVIISPIDDIAQGAEGLGPFPLPRVPAKVDQFWTFKSGVGTAPTLPLVALQVWALQSPELAQKSSKYLGPAAGAAITTYLDSTRRHADLKRLMSQLRRIALEDKSERPAIYTPLDGLPDAAALKDTETRILRGLIGAYRGTNSYFINFYGPAGTITTVPYDKLLTATEPNSNPDLRGKVIFIGVSELTTADRKEGFYTVFSRDDGIDLSGVEIAATALANLLDGDMLSQLNSRASAAAVFAFGVIVVIVAILLLGLRGGIASIAFSAICFVGAQYAFTKHNLWLPISVPLLVQLPLAILLGLLIHYGFARRLSENFARGVRYYVPDSIAQNLALGKEPAVSTEIVEGVCLLTDLADYTPLSESLSPEALASLTNQYYRLVGGPIEAHGGDVLRYTGDGMVCAWTKTNFKSENDMHHNACLAALEIREEIDGYNLENASDPLSIRIGLHAGKFALGNVGGGHHYEQSVLGDVINTASRIEGLNKKLRTKILASGPIAADPGAILFRRLGMFQLAGKSEIVSIFEIIQRNEQATPEQVELCRRFEEMLRAFESENWKETARKLDQILSVYPEDEPAIIYRDLCDRYLVTPPQPGASAVVIIKQK